MTKAKKDARSTGTRAKSGVTVERAEALPNDAPARYTWEQLAAKIGDASEQEFEDFSVNVSTADLVKQGATVRSERILTDGLRWIGQIYQFWSKLKPAERAEFIGFSDARMRVLFARLRALKSAVARNAAAPNHAAALAKAVREAEETYRRGQRSRRRLVSALVQAAQSDASLAAQVAAANQPASDAAQLAKTLRALADVARAATASRAVATHGQLQRDGVTDAWLDQLVALAAALEAAAGTGGKASEKPIPQSEIDRLDGVCLLVLQDVRRVFAAAQEEDPRVPTLVPLATRSVFGMSSGGPEEKPAPSEEDRPKA
jgi:hypothetical protein